MTAICVIPNCGQEAPPNEGFCPAHSAAKWVGTETLYQAFKKRLIDELLVDVHGSPNYGRLLPKENESTTKKAPPR